MVAELQDVRLPTRPHRVFIPRGLGRRRAPRFREPRKRFQSHPGYRLSLTTRSGDGRERKTGQSVRVRGPRCALMSFWVLGRRRLVFRSRPKTTLHDREQFRC